MKEDSPRCYEKVKDTLLGRGGFGKVRLLRDSTTKEEFAAKKIALREGDDEDQILQEVRMLQKLSHPSIVKYFGHFKDEAKKKITIRLEYCSGKCLF